MASQEVSPVLKGFDVNSVFATGVASKIVCMDFHPYFPWIVTAHKNLSIAIWDYNLKKTIFDFNLLNLDEEDSENFNPSSNIVGVASAPAIGGGVQSSASSTDRKGVGNIKLVQFYDGYTKRLKALVESGYKIVGGLAESKKVPISTDQNVHAVIIITESRVIFFDYRTLLFTEVKPQHFENKPQLSVDFFADSSLICFGGSDGHIRIWDYEKQELKRKLSGGHKTGIVKLFANHGKGGESKIFSASLDGTVCSWDINAEKENGSPKKLVPGDMIGFKFNYIDLSLVIAESKPTNERSIYSWNPCTHSEARRTKLKMKAILTSLEAFPHPRFSSSAILFTCKGDTKVYVLTPDGNTKDLFDFSTICPPHMISHAKKLYWAAVHPTNTHVIVCSTNVGLFIYHIERTWTPNITKCITSDNRFSLYTVQSDKITSHDLDTDRGNLLKRTAIKGLEHSSAGVSLMSSPSGKYLTAFWPELHLYQIFDLNTGCKVIEEGPAYSFTWASAGDRYAFLEYGSPDAKQEKKKKGVIASVLSSKTKKSSEKTQATHGRLRIKEIDSDQSCKDVQGDLSWFLQALNAKVVQLFGGSLLGVVIDPGATVASPVATTHHNPESAPVQQPKKRPQSTRDQGVIMSSASAGLGQAAPPVVEAAGPTELSFIQFYSWITQDAIGSQLPPPLSVISSDSSTHMLALVYPKYVAIFSLVPNMKLVFTLDKYVSAGIFYRGTFFYATDNTIEAVFPKAQDQEPIILARSNFDYQSGSDCSTRPIGAISFISVFYEKILLSDSLCNSHVISLNNPLVQFYILVASNAVDRALQRVPLVGKEHHSSLAEFLVQMGYPAEAVKLPGISTKTLLQVTIKYNLHDVATDTLTDLLEKFIQVESSRRARQEKIPLEFLSKSNSPTHGSVSSPRTPNISPLPSPRPSHELQLSRSFSRNFGVKDIKAAPPTEVDVTIVKLLSLAKTIANSAMASNQYALAEKLFQKISFFEPEVNKDLAQIYIAEGRQDKLTALYNSLISTKQYDIATFIAFFLEEDLLISALQKSSNFSEYVAYSSSSDRGGLIKNWNTSLERASAPYHDLKFQ